MGDGSASHKGNKHNLAEDRGQIMLQIKQTSVATMDQSLASRSLADRIEPPLALYQMQILTMAEAWLKTS